MSPAVPPLPVWTLCKAPSQCQGPSSMGCRRLLRWAGISRTAFHASLFSLQCRRPPSCVSLPEVTVLCLFFSKTNGKLCVPLGQSILYSAWLEERWCWPPPVMFSKGFVTREELGIHTEGLMSPWLTHQGPRRI